MTTKPDLMPIRDGALPSARPVEARRKTRRGLGVAFTTALLATIQAPSARAQSETAKTLDSSGYTAIGFPIAGQGAVPIGPLVPSLYGNPHLFGDWGGAQSWMQKRGIFLNIALNEEYMGNVTGGRTRDNVLAGQVAAELDIDWQKLAGFQGFWTHLLVVNGHGRNFSSTLGDYVSNPEQIYGSRGNVVAHLVSMYADKTFLHDRVILSAGVIPTGTFFDFDALACNFMNVSVCGNFAPGKYAPGGRDWPSANIGAVLRVRPTERTYIMGGFSPSAHTPSMAACQAGHWPRMGLANSARNSKPAGILPLARTSCSAITRSVSTTTIRAIRISTKTGMAGRIRPAGWVPARNPACGRAG